MKRIAVFMVTVLIALTAAAHPIRYFTERQAARTVAYLNAQDEIMIYCGYDYEVETYVLVNEVWRERVNSAYYEIWVYGFDAYTGDEVYMPLDLNCVWLFGHGKMYSAAHYLRFITDVRMPSFTWYVPAYNHFTRVVHRHGYVRTYHYDIHCYGWIPPVYGSTHPGPRPHHNIPPYYNRHRTAAVPVPAAAWTPGVDKPRVVTRNTDASPARVVTGTPATESNSRGTGTTTSTNSRGNSTSATTTTNSRGTSTTPTRSSSTNSRGTSASSSSTSSRGTSTSSSSTSSRGTSTSSSSTSSRGTSTSSSSTSSRGTSTSSSSTSSRGASTSSTSSKKTSTTSTRSSSSSRGASTTGSSSTGSRGSSATTSSNSRGTSSRR